MSAPAASATVATRILGIDPGLRNTGFGVIDVTGSKLAYVSFESKKPVIYVHTLATGGQVNALAARRTQVARGASIDVSGAVGVNVAMASNNVLINAQGNEQRDAPVDLGRCPARPADPRRRCESGQRPGYDGRQQHLFSRKDQ